MAGCIFCAIIGSCLFNAIIVGCFFPVLGFFVFAEVFNDVMFTQSDDRMVGLWEHQREGLGMILAGISIIFFWYKEGDD